MSMYRVTLMYNEGESGETYTVSTAYDMWELMAELATYPYVTIEAIPAPLERPRDYPDWARP